MPWNSPKCTIFDLSDNGPSKTQICPGVNTNEIQILYAKHHKVFLLVHNSVKYEVLIKQYLRSILAMGAAKTEGGHKAKD